MKNFEVKVQEKGNFCLCSVLQAIFKKYNINLSQTEIANNLVPAVKGFLVNNDEIRNFLKSNGFKYNLYWHDNVPFNEYDSLLKDMNEDEGIIGINSHVYLLKDFNDPYLEMIDPENCHTVKKDISSLLKEMKKTEGFFGLLKPLQKQQF